MIGARILALTFAGLLLASAAQAGVVNTFATSSGKAPAAPAIATRPKGPPPLPTAVPVTPVNIANFEIPAAPACSTADGLKIAQDIAVSAANPRLPLDERKRLAKQSLRCRQAATLAMSRSGLLKPAEVEATSAQVERINRLMAESDAAMKAQLQGMFNQLQALTPPGTKPPAMPAVKW